MCDQFWLALLDKLPAITAALGAVAGLFVSLRNGGKLNDVKDMHQDTAGKVETLVSNSVSAPR